MRCTGCSCGRHCRRRSRRAVPAFAHTPAAALPAWSEAGLDLRLLIGEAFGRRSPVATFAPTLYLDVAARAGATLELPALAAGFERAVYGVDAPLVVDGSVLPPHSLAILAPDVPATITASADARFVVIGGAPLDGPRFLWWNFVSSRRERIAAAKADWTAQRMGTIEGETEWIPLP